MPPADAAYKLAFEPPSNIVLTGSWATKTGVKAKDKKPWTVDVALEMPAVSFISLLDLFPFCLISGATNWYFRFLGFIPRERLLEWSILP